MTGEPVGTIKSRIHYATETMRAALEADERPGAAAGTAGMNDGRPIEERITHWLEQEAPDDVPNFVLESAFARTQSLPQERPSFAPPRLRVFVPQPPRRPAPGGGTAGRRIDRRGVRRWRVPPADQPAQRDPSTGPDPRRGSAGPSAGGNRQRCRGLRYRRRQRARVTARRPDRSRDRRRADDARARSSGLGRGSSVDCGLADRRRIRSNTAFPITTGRTG